MAIERTVESIVDAKTWTRRIQQIRLVPQHHGTDEQVAIYAAVARQLYVPHLTPDFAYIHEAEFYETEHFFAAYDAALNLTNHFTRVSVADIQAALMKCPRTLLVFRTLLGLTKEEFAFSTMLVNGSEKPVLSASQVDKMERSAIDYKQPTGKATLAKATEKARVGAETIARAMDGTLFGAAVAGLKRKQAKPDTAKGWDTVHELASRGVPLRVFLHQRHYGGAFRQVLDATSTQRGALIEDAVEHLFTAHYISFVRTGSHNQGDIAARFEVRVTPAPDFVVFDPRNGILKAMLECKGTNNGGTARDKALRFQKLKAESVRLGGVPLIAVLGGAGWTRINDALGPVIRDTDGRVFTLSTLSAMLDVAPFPDLIAAAAATAP